MNEFATRRQGQLVLPTTDLDSDLAFFIELGFRIKLIFPADDPLVAVLTGHGLCLRLDQTAMGPKPGLRLEVHSQDPLAGQSSLTSPSGCRIQIHRLDQPLSLPHNRAVPVVSQLDGGANWVRGRAGMLYRDLIPGRWGGRFIASHIQIPDGGPVPDYVHFHKIRFQMIFCVKGWVEVVYEDQGPPFRLEAGDCLLQPPQIRHRVLECSSQLEVVEIGCPAEHETHADWETTLPTDNVRPERDFGGQRFVIGRTAGATWRPWRLSGYEACNTGIMAASAGLADVRVVRLRGQTPAEKLVHEGEFFFMFVLAGSVTVTVGEGERQTLNPADSLALPAQVPMMLEEPCADLSFLVVSLP